MQGATDTAPAPQIHVAVGYPVQDVQFMPPPPAAALGGEVSEVSVRYMKTLISLVFILSCVHSSLLLLCVVYLQHMSKACSLPSCAVRGV